MRKRLALAVLGLGLAASYLPVTSAAAICELPNGQPCPNYCPWPYVNGITDKYAPAVPDFQCMT